MTHAIADAQFSLLNGFLRCALPSISSAVAELSPEAIKRLEGSRNGWQSLRDHHFGTLLLMTKMVAIGVILEGPELVYELSNVIRRWIKRPIREHAPGWITFVGLAGWVVVSIGVAGEFWVDSKVNSDDQKIQTINEQLLQDASASAVTAATAAGSAQDSAAAASAASGAAETTADSAIGLARGARTEADSFEHDIASAKQQAADAESHLADALQRAANAETELEQLKTPRSIDRLNQLVSELQRFKGTKYVFQSVFQDEESINLLKSINDVLQQAGWERDKSMPGFPSVLVYGKAQPDFSVPIGFNTGVEVFADNPVLSDWSTTKATDLPVHLQAASALNVGLGNTILPSEKGNAGALVLVDKGSSTTVRIAVGKKPVG